MKIVDNRPIIEKATYDIVVVGGGISGVAAAVAAARQQMRVLLLEKSIQLGGLLTSGLISYYEPLCDGQGRQMIAGIAEELIKLCIKDGFDNLSEDWKTKQGEHKGWYATFFSPTAFVMGLDEFVIKNGVEIRFDAHAVFPVVEENVCKGVVVESKGGKEFYAAKAVIDATGDAEIAERAGIPTVTGTNYLLGMAHYTNKSLAEKYVQGGEPFRFRKWLYALDETNTGKKLYTGTTSEDITDYVLKGRAAVLKKIRKEDKETREVMTLPTMPQYRTIRRIVGKSVFCGIPDERFEDEIGHCGDWKTFKAHYNIPYGSLYNPSFPNIWAVGRIISTNDGNGWEMARVAPVCALTGQAAGTAAAICIQENYTADSIPVRKLQQQLRNAGCFIEETNY